MNLAATVDLAQTTRRGRRVDLAIGIVLGIVLGIAVVSSFVFLGSEDTIDAPRISGVDTGKPQGARPPPGNRFR